MFELRIITVSVMLFPGMVTIAGAESDSVVRDGKHFRVICHFNNPRLADEAMRVADSVRDAAAELYPSFKGDKGFLGEVHIYESVDDYQRADKELTGGQFQRNWAFAHSDTRTAHIALQPPCSKDALERIGIPYQTSRLIAHEAAHLIRYDLFPNHLSHPDWLANGTALHLATKASIKGGWGDPWERMPYTSSHISRIVELASSDQLISVKDILCAAPDELSFYDRYALHAVLFQFLATGQYRSLLSEILNEAGRLGGGPRYVEKLSNFITTKIGPDTLSRMDRDFKQYIKSLSPQWEEVYRSLETSGDAWTQIAFPDANAIAWQTEAVNETTYGIEGGLEILPGNNTQMNILLDRSGQGFISIALVAGYGVSVFEYNARNNQWIPIANEKVDAILPDRKFTFALKIANNRLSLEINSRSILDVPVEERTLKGPWGLGAQAGSAGIWYSVKLSK